MQTALGVWECVFVGGGNCTWCLKGGGGGGGVVGGGKGV